MPAPARGMLSFAQRRFEPAIAAYDRALALWRSDHDNPHPTEAEFLLARGQALRAANRVEAAERDAALGLSIIETTLGAQHPAAVGFHLLLAECADDRGTRAQARAALRRAEEVAHTGDIPAPPPTLEELQRVATKLRHRAGQTPHADPERSYTAQAPKTR